MRIISGEYGGRNIKSATGPGLRPSTDKVRQAMFSMLEARGVDWDGLLALDCFAGSGSLGMEALSRGALLVWFVEKNRTAANMVRENLENFKVAPERFKVMPMDILSLVKKQAKEQFDLVFLDPPYGKGLVRTTLELLIKNNWIAPDGLVLAELEADAKIDFSGIEASFSNVADRTYGQTRIIIWRS